MTEDSQPKVETKLEVHGSEEVGDYFKQNVSRTVTLYLMSDGTVQWNRPEPYNWEEN